MIGDCSLAEAPAASRSNREPSPIRSILDPIPTSATALQRAHQIGLLVGAVGFDWPDPPSVWAKVQEEIREVAEAISKGNPSEIYAELGDLFFSLAQYTRHFGMESEGALHQACDTFCRRFGYIEERLAISGLDLQKAPLDLLEQLWKEAKHHFAQLQNQQATPPR